MIYRARYRSELIIVQISLIYRDYRDIRRLSFALLLHNTVQLFPQLTSQCLGDRICEHIKETRKHSPEFDKEKKSEEKVKLDKEAHQDTRQNVKLDHC